MVNKLAVRPAGQVLKRWFCTETDQQNTSSIFLEYYFECLLEECQVTVNLHQNETVLLGGKMRASVASARLKTFDI